LWCIWSVTKNRGGDSPPANIFPPGFGMGKNFLGNLPVMLAARKIRHFDFELFDPGVLTCVLYSEAKKNLVVKLEANRWWSKSWTER